MTDGMEWLIVMVVTTLPLCALYRALRRRGERKLWERVRSGRCRRSDLLVYQPHLARV